MNTTATHSPLVPVLKRRMKALRNLGIATVVTVLCAVVAQWQIASNSDPAFEPVKMFPDLAAKLDDIATIQVEAKTGAFNITRTATGQWSLPDKSGYRADFNTVRKTILALSDLTLVEQKTARADWHEKLGVALPKSGGTGVLLTLKDGKGEVVASLIAGSSVEGASAGDRQAIYVRKPAEAQTFAARGSLQAIADQSQWLEKAFLDLASDRVKSVSMKPVRGAPYSVSRAKPDTTNFVIDQRIPAGRMLRTEGEPNGVGNALLGISFTDVAPQSKINFTNASRATYQTFDGLALNISIAEQNGDHWIAVDAVALNVPPPAAEDKKALKPDIAKEVEDLNKALGGWAFKIPKYKGTLLTAPMDDLLRPVG